ncbi:nucleoporin Nup85-like protein [Chytriomyces sp. MP71]|nr:nucleoporin Nup85-like protein [Chytriomyces sp. MP71]
MGEYARVLGHVFSASDDHLYAASRSALLASLCSVFAAASGRTGAAHSYGRHYLPCLDTARQAASLWTLTDALLFAASPSAPVAPHLVAWINNTTQQKPSKQCFDVLASIPAAGLLQQHPFYWTYIHHCLIRAHLYAACAMIQRHPEFNNANTHNNNNPYARLVSLIQSIPKPAAYASTVAFDRDWTAWKRNVKLATHMATAASAELDARDVQGLAVAFGILAGNVELIVQACSAAPELEEGDENAMDHDEDAIQDNEGYPWMDALVAVIIYTDPTCTADSIPLHIQTLRDIASADFIPSLPASSLDPEEEEDLDGIDPYELAILATLERDFDAAALRYATALDLPVAVHLISTLTHYAHVNPDAPIYFATPDAATITGQASVRDLLLLEHARRLSTPTSSWTHILLAFQYLSILTKEGNPHARTQLQDLLLRPDLDPSGTRFRKLLSIAHTAHLTTALETLHERAAQRALSQTRPAQSLAHYVAAKLPERAGAVAETQLMPRFLATSGDRVLNEAVAQLPARVVQGVPRAALLVKIAALRAHVRAGEEARAGAVVVELLQSGVAPRRLWGRLIADAVPLLAGVTMGSEACYELLRCLEVVVEEEGETAWVGVCDGDGGKEVRVGEVRVALAKRLAKSLM